MTFDNEKAFYVCINKGEAICPNEISQRSICIHDDIRFVMEKLFDAKQLSSINSD